MTWYTGAYRTTYSTTSTAINSSYGYYYKYSPRREKSWKEIIEGEVK